MDSVKDIMNSFNSELNSVLNVLKTTKMSETKVKSIEKSLNAMKDMFETEVKQRSDEKRDNQKNRDKRVKTNQEIEDRSEESVIGGKALKASFDRFGDDLSELIVSYLTIEDKFRFQCLSKQWRTLGFNRHY